MAADLTELTDAELEAELLKLTRSRQSGTKVQAKGAAIRTILKRRQQTQREEREHQRQREREQAERDVEWRAEEPDESAPVDYWPYGGGHPQEGDPDGTRDIYACDTKRVRDGWREAVEGPPPWRKRGAPTAPR